MSVEQMDLQQIVEEFGTVEHKVEFTKVELTQNGSQWECRATYVGNIEEYNGSVTSAYDYTKLAAARAALVKARANKPELWADLQ